MAENIKIKDVSGNYYSTNDFVSQNKLEKEAEMLFGKDWEAEDDVKQLEQLISHIGVDYDVFVTDDWDESMSAYQEQLNHATSDSNYDMFVVDNSNYAKGGKIDVFQKSSDGFIYKKTMPQGDGRAFDRAKQVIDEYIKYDEFDRVEVDGKKVSPKEFESMRDKFHNQSFSKGGEVNGKYLDSISADKKSKILNNIAKHYGISSKAAEEEVIDLDAENLFEYIANDNSLRREVYNDFERKNYGIGGFIAGVAVGVVGTTYLSKRKPKSKSKTFTAKSSKQHTYYLDGKKKTEYYKRGEGFYGILVEEKGLYYIIDTGAGTLKLPKKDFSISYAKGGSMASGGEIEFDTKPIKGESKQLKNSTHFGIHKPTNSIVYNWDYKGYDKEELDSDKEHYFWGDVQDEVEANVDKFKKSDYAIVERKNLSKKGIDLDNYLWFRGQKYAKGGSIKKSGYFTGALSFLNW